MRLIDADNVIEELLPITRYGNVTGNVVASCIVAIKNAPTIDAEPVRHGRWEYGSGWYPPTCSSCGLVPLTPGYVGDVNFYERYFKRCPHCGAKMDEEDNT